MRAVDLIRRKRDGGSLGREQVKDFIAGLTSGAVSEGQVAAFAMAVFFRGMEDERVPDDPYFFPLYQEAEALDMSICIHTGARRRMLTNPAATWVMARATTDRAASRLRQAGADGVVAPAQIGGMRLASELVRPSVVGFLDQMLRDSGHYGPKVVVSADADEQTQLLAFLGRHP